MWCSFPPPLTDDQLTAALDGDADTVVQQHLDQCPSCAARLAQAQQAEYSIKHQLQGLQLSRRDCPPAQRLGEYHLALVGQSEERTIARHVEQCAYCQAELEELRVFLSPAPQPAVQPAPQPRPRRRLGELIAQLLPPTEARTRPAFALRGGATTGPLIAEVEGITIVLDVQPSPDGRVIVLGQLVADDLDSWIGALVELRQDGTLLLTTTVDDLCSFSCERVPPGQTSLRITSEHGRSLVLEDVALNI